MTSMNLHELKLNPDNESEKEKPKENASDFSKHKKKKSEKESSKKSHKHKKDKKTTKDKKHKKANKDKSEDNNNIKDKVRACVLNDKGTISPNLSPTPLDFNSTKNICKRTACYRQNTKSKNHDSESDCSRESSVEIIYKEKHEVVTLSDSEMTIDDSDDTLRKRLKASTQTAHLRLAENSDKNIKTDGSKIKPDSFLAGTFNALPTNIEKSIDMVDIASIPIPTNKSPTPTVQVNANIDKSSHFFRKGIKLDLKISKESAAFISSGIKIESSIQTPIETNVKIISSENDSDLSRKKSDGCNSDDSQDGNLIKKRTNSVERENLKDKADIEISKSGSKSDEKLNKSRDESRERSKSRVKSIDETKSRRSRDGSSSKPQNSKGRSKSPKRSTSISKSKDDSKDGSKRQNQSRNRSRQSRKKSSSREGPRNTSKSRNGSLKTREKSKHRDSLRRSRERSKSRKISRRSKDRSSSRDRSKRSKSRDRSRKSRQISRRSKSRDRSGRPKSRDRSRRSKSRDRSRRSKSRDRSRRSKSRDRSRRSRSQDTKKRERSTDSKRSKKSCSDEDHMSFKIDKIKLRQIAIKNALQNATHIACPQSTVKPVDKVPAKNDGKSLEELTEFCKRIAEVSAEEIQGILNGNTQVIDEEEMPFIPARTNKDMKNGPILNPMTLQEKMAHVVEMSSLFPVSSGKDHNDKEANDVVGAVESTRVIPTTEPITEPAITAETNTVELEDSKPKSAFSKVELMTSKWVSAKEIPGQFTGLTNLQPLSQQELSGSFPLWVKKDAISSAPPLAGGIGKLLLKKMGWKEGEGLGKNNEGMTVPLSIDIKTDRKGLVAPEEDPDRIKKLAFERALMQHVMIKQAMLQQTALRQALFGRPNLPNPQAFLQMPLRPGFQPLRMPCARPNLPPMPCPPAPEVSDVTLDKHPVSILTEICSKRHWDPPEFILLEESGPAHNKIFKFKIILNGVEYVSPNGCSQKKIAKMEAAAVCLNHLGLLPQMFNY